MAKRPRLEQSGSSVSSSLFPLEDLSALDEEEFELTADIIVSGYTLQQQSRLHLVLERRLSRDFLSLLPPEIAFKILGYLDMEDLLHGLQVCRKWRQLITEATPAWKAVAKKHGPSHLLAEELKFRLPVPIYDLLKGGTETDIQQKPLLFHPQTKLIWTKCADLPLDMFDGQTVVIGDKVHVGGYMYDTVCSYSLSEDVWNFLPVFPIIDFGLGQLEERVVAIWGRRSFYEITNKVYVLDEDSQSWKDSIIPPMPTPRWGPAVLSHHSSLIVAGGVTPSGPTSVVELFRRDTSQWHRTCPLPFPCRNVSSVVIQNIAYLLGGGVAIDGYSRSEGYLNRVLYTSVDSLLQKSLPPDQTSEDSDSVWKTLPSTPHYGSAAATVGGCLLAVGGGNTSEYLGSTPQKEVYIYSPSTASWRHVSDLPSPRLSPTTATISPTEFLVIGGRDSSNTPSCDVFKSSLEIH